VLPARLPSFRRGPHGATDLVALERAFLRDEGLPGRPWFKHQVYAPGFYTGYGVKTLPAIREALEQRQCSLVAAQVELVAKTIDG
jgi:N-acetylated-alpha-linked acidic dipeptidase